MISDDKIITELKTMKCSLHFKPAVITVEDHLFKIKTCCNEMDIIIERKINRMKQKYGEDIFFHRL